MKRTWQQALVDWMNNLAFSIECFNLRRRWRAEVRCELIKMDSEDKIRQYEEAARRAAIRLETCADPPKPA